MSMLSTVDNPYNPIDDYENWYRWDISHGYDTCAVLARLVTLNPTMSDPEKETLIEEAIDRLIAEDPANLFIKVVSKD